MSLAREMRQLADNTMTQIKVMDEAIWAAMMSKFKDQAQLGRYSVRDPFDLVLYGFDGTVEDDRKQRLRKRLQDEGFKVESIPENPHRQGSRPVTQVSW